ncbi:SusD/RagB family nutrient-binding outer membrane lipoprotein [Myroides odoratimimus]|uniref:SusD/RagB family nutrient-binding outer membrane lipoprotein n=1 Tax=Myroides odoratimimus TaxID=76832 RepID=UPI002575AA15|nr:SusD/RagB family nutrient-binding outer membrane lipoprotein [Myroides odoratimimus]MDM1498385.1 SusD/RagB family nutrient-binding outer membrane lipoprotein [Myroides odoratimimus]
MKIKNIFLGLSATVLLTVSCTSDFEEKNIDPNRLQQISPATLLNPIIYEMASHNMYRSWSHNNHLMQDIVVYPSDVPGMQRYDLSDDVGASSWNAYYRWLKNARDMEYEAVKVADPNYEAMALTLKAWITSNLTDLFGDVPYFEASKGEEKILYPTFDSQEKIYDSLLADLERANSLYDLNRKLVYNPDILYIDSKTYWDDWQKFTNSLHLRLLLRISNKENKNAYQRMLTILNDPDKYPIINDVKSQANLKITGVTPNISPWSRIQDFTLSRKMASFFIDNLNDFNDPRLPLYATEAYRVEGKKKIYIGYKGIPSAFDGSDSQFDYEASTLNNVMAANPTEAPILTYAEVLFIKAELAQKGYLSDAKSYYEQAVKEAITSKGLEMPTNYFTLESTRYNGTLERIMLQKYYALYMNDYQQWFEYKRTGYPKLPKTESMLNDGNMPNRFPYPINIRTQNKGNYEKKVAEMGGDNINYKMWWQN